MRRTASRPYDRSDTDPQAKTALAINVITGALLIALPFLLDYTAIRDAVWNDVIVGAIVVTGSLVAVSLMTRRDRGPVRLLSLILAALGVWLIAAPHVLDYAAVDEPLWTDTITGAVITVMSLWSAATARDLAMRLRGRDRTLEEDELPEHRRAA